MQVTFKRPLHPELTASVDASILDVAHMAAAGAGLFDVDLEPMEPGKVKVTARGRGATLHFTGKDLTEACGKLIEALCGT